MLIRFDLLNQLRNIIGQVIKQKAVSIDLIRPTSTLVDMQQLTEGLDFDKEDSKIDQDYGGDKQLLAE